MKPRQIRNDSATSLDDELARLGVPPVLTLRRAAEISGMNAQVLGRLAKAGILPAHRTRTIRGRGPYRLTRHDLVLYLVGKAAR